MLESTERRLENLKAERENAWASVFTSDFRNTAWIMEPYSG